MYFLKKYCKLLNNYCFHRDLDLHSKQYFIKNLYFLKLLYIYIYLDRFDVLI
jgi:hypothetical protein